MASRSRSCSRNHGYRVFLTKINGDNMSYGLPLTVLQLEHELPTLAEDFMHRIMNGTNVLKDSQRLEEMDYHVTIAIVKVECDSWCPKSWNGVVPEVAHDRSGNLPQSTEEAARSIYRCMRSCCVDVESYGDTAWWSAAWKWSLTMLLNLDGTTGSFGSCLYTHHLVTYIDACWFLKQIKIMRRAKQIHEFEKSLVTWWYVLTWLLAVWKGQLTVFFKGTRFVVFLGHMWKDYWQRKL